MLGGAYKVVPEGTTEVFLLVPVDGRATPVNGVAVLAVLLLLLGSTILRLLLDFFANLETCCTGFPCFPLSPLEGFVGIRLVDLVGCSEFWCCCGLCRKCDRMEDMSGVCVRGATHPSSQNYLRSRGVGVCASLGCRLSTVCVFVMS